MLELTRKTGIGAQFGGKYFCHDVRVITFSAAWRVLPCRDRCLLLRGLPGDSEDHQERVFLEQLETDPAQYLPDTTADELADDVVRIDLSRPMTEIRAELSRYPMKTRLALSGPMAVARQIAHAKIAELLDAGQPMPAYMRDHAVHYAGPAKTPAGYASGSFGPTPRQAGWTPMWIGSRLRAGRLSRSPKGNRSAAVTAVCQKHGGFYLGSIGGAAAKLAQDCCARTASRPARRTTLRRTAVTTMASSA